MERAPAPAAPATLYAYKVLPYSDAAVNELTIHQAMAAGCAYILPLVAVFDNMLHNTDPILALVGRNPAAGQARYLIAVMPALACDALDLLINGYFSESQQMAVHLSVPQIKEMVRQMAVALAHIHANNYIHADFKLENVLVAQVEPHVRICVCDFGFSRPIGAPRVKFQHSAPYVAPEMVRAYTMGPIPHGGVSMGSSIDLWALGVCLYTLLVRSQPFPTQRNPQNPTLAVHPPLAVLMRGYPQAPLVQAGVDVAGVVLVSALLSPSVDRRPRAESVAVHPYLSS